MNSIEIFSAAQIDKLSGLINELSRHFSAAHIYPYDLQNGVKLLRSHAFYVKPFLKQMCCSNRCIIVTD